MTPLTMEHATGRWSRSESSTSFNALALSYATAVTEFVVVDEYRQETRHILIPGDRTSDLMADGYREMSQENLELANAYLPLVLETWPEWE